METKNALIKGTVLKGSSYSYLIERILGQGSFGITYLASVKMAGALGSIDAKIKVAIKEFFMRDINGRADSTVTSGSKGGIYDEYKRKFQREAINLSKLQHEHIIKVIESFEANNTVYYVMEFMEGGSLDDYITKNQGLREADAVKLVRQIGSALSYMHSQGFLHLDLKPSNIMRKESGDVVLIDFGLSKQYNSDGNPESSTKVGAGTPGYAPIEQANYREGKGFPVTMDIYALGATMFKMLTGVRPPEASDILNEGFPFQELQSRKVSDRTIACIAKAMAPIKKDRYQSVADFLNALESEETLVNEVEVTVEVPNRQPSSHNQPSKATPQQPVILQPSAIQSSPKVHNQSSSTKNRKWLWVFVGTLIVAAIVCLVVSLKKTPDTPFDQAINLIKEVTEKFEYAENDDELLEIVNSVDARMQELSDEIDESELTEEQQQELKEAVEEMSAAYITRMRELGYDVDDEGNIITDDAEADSLYYSAEADSAYYY